MQQRHIDKLEQHSDTMRYVLDLVCRATDSRLDEEDRVDAALEIADREGSYQALCDVREVFRSMANMRTDQKGGNHGLA